MNLFAVTAFWIVVAFVCTFLGYRQGRQDEELDWRRALSEKGLKIKDWRRS